MTFHAITQTPVSFLAYRATPVEDQGENAPFLRTNIGASVADLSAEQALALSKYITENFQTDEAVNDGPAETPQDISDWAVASDEDV